MTQALLVAITLTLARQAEKPAPPPLTEQQIQRISKLAKDTQKEAVRLKALLGERQKELARVYEQYELDEKQAVKLEAEIVELQKKMLANYREMQIDLRKLIGEDRFKILKQRLDRMLNPPSSSRQGDKEKGRQGDKR